MRLIVRDADTEATAREIVPPVADDLLWWGFLNTDDDKVERNFSDGSLGSLAGAPTVESGYTTFDAPAQYLSAAIAETDYMTFCFAMKAVSDPASTATAPVAAGNYVSSPLKGLMMWFTAAAGGSPFPAAALRFTVVTDSANQCALQVTDADEWKFYIGVARSGAVDLYNMTDGTSATLVTTGARAKNTDRIRIGAGVSQSFGGTMDIAGGCIYGRALDEDERSAVYTYWKDTYLPSKSITV
ncbi:hypothetical protein [Phenylobacterium sp.]|uniref:hypothetical protein n=1 Tax=Phenylobacterium sp. TaxID=1871053 RepID=UPI00300237EE